MPEFIPWKHGDLVTIYLDKERKDKKYGLVEADGTIRVLSKREATRERRARNEKTSDHMHDRIRANRVVSDREEMNRLKRVIRLAYNELGEGVPIEKVRGDLWRSLVWKVGRITDNLLEPEHVPPQASSGNEQLGTELKGENAEDWRMLLTIPVGWRPETKTYIADMDEHGKPKDMHSIDTDGVVRIHPDANENAIRWALHLEQKVPREALGLPGVGGPPDA